MFFKNFQEDLNTLKRLSFKQKIQYIFDYYKWKIFVFIFSIITLFTFSHLLWEGQKDYRLQICAILTTECDYSLWFSDFESTLPTNKTGNKILLNQDQIFDSASPYSYIYETQIFSSISSGRIDFVLCNEDTYQYLLSINACISLEDVLQPNTFQTLLSKNMLDFNTSGIRKNKDNSFDYSNSKEAYYSVILNNTAFASQYGNSDSLYAIIISNTENLEDCILLLQSLIQE